MSTQQLRSTIRQALILGLDVERNDPAMADAVPDLTYQQVDWIASWLASELDGEVDAPEPSPANVGPALDHIRDTIVEVLCSQALADHLGDVRNAESQLWDLLGAPKLPSDHPAYYSDSPWQVTKARLQAAGLSLPEYLGDFDDDD